MAGIKLTKIEDAFTLPKGSLVIDMGFRIEVGVTPDNVEECAKLIIDKEVDALFLTQSGVVAYAGNNLGWGQGSGYETSGGHIEGTVSDELLAAINKALSLPKGRLAVNMGFMVEVSPSESEVIEAMTVLHENEATENLYSQAGVLARAGNEHGWGAGGGYTVL